MNGEQLAADLKRIADVVHRVVTGAGDLTRLQAEARAEIHDASRKGEEHTIDRLLRVGEALSRDDDVASFEKRCFSLAPLLAQEAMLHGGRDAAREKSTDAEHQSEVHANLLTAIWLGLYFVGLMFNDPWERARRIADKLGGYPRGAFINKAIGDVYRTARRVYVRDKTCAPSGVTVLTRRPFLLLKPDALPQSSKVTVPTLISLGRFYVLYQLRLYLDSGLKFTYLVPKLALEQRLKKDEERAATIAAMAAWMKEVVRTSRTEQRFSIVDSPQSTGGIPTCVLGWRSGVYTLEGASEDDDMDVPLAGNRISGVLASSYRNKLESVTGSALEIEDLHDSLKRALSIRGAAGE